MKTLKSAVAAAELLLVFPAGLFMTALFVRNLQPPNYEPAHTAQRIVDWFAASPHLGLAVLLMALPLAVLLIGAFTLWQAWRSDADLRQSAHQLTAMVRGNFATLLITLATLSAGGILAIVALHVVTD
jgi:hypothetical protein